MKNFTKVLIALMVLTIFAVGCVSAEDVADVEVPTEEIDVDDSVVDVVEDEETEIEEESSESLSSWIDVNNTTPDIQQYIENHTVINFSSQNYGNVSFNIINKTNITFIGNGAILNGDGVNDIFLVNDSSNIIIKDFIININGAKHGIYGSYVNGSTFTNLELYNGKDGININHYQYNLTITNNYLHNITRDGISIVDHENHTYDEVSNFVPTLIANNRIVGAEIGIFVGGTLRGNIRNNNITDFTGNGIEFDGKPIGTVRTVMGNITNNVISNGVYGIVFINETLYDLNIASNDITQTTAGIYTENVDINSLNVNDNNILDTTLGICFIGETDGNSINAVISNNTIENVTAGIYLENMNITSLSIENNDISDALAGIYTSAMDISGLTIDSNTITDSYFAISFIGESSGNTINTTIYDNEITDVTVGLYFENITVVYLDIDYNTIQTVDYFDDYVITVVNFSKTSGGYFGMTYNMLYGCIKANPIINLLTEYVGNYGYITWEY